MQPGETIREFVNRRATAMELERSTFIQHWMELTQFLQPRRGRYFVTDVNRGDKRWQNIINSRGTQSLRAARAGLLAGVMSPARQWFNLITPDPDMMEFAPVKQWLYQVEQLLLTIFASGNLYTMAPVLIGQLLQFGTGCMSQVDDFDNVARFYTHPVGSFCLGQNDRYEIDTMTRVFTMTVRSLVTKYGLDALSRTARTLWDQGNYETPVQVRHFVSPNFEFDPKRLESKFKRWRSITIEEGSNTRDGVLRDAGYDVFPAHAPRWDVEGEDVYATDCPGMTVLGDIKGLQNAEREKAKAIAKMVAPPMKGPPSLRNVPVNQLPGGLTIYDPGTGGNDALSPLYMVNPQVQQLVLDIEHHEARIREGFYEDLFRSIDSMEGVQPQNQLFLSMKNAEKLLQLGPVLERLHGEFLNRLVDRTFLQCLRAGILPPPPQEIRGQVLRTRYISSLAMAQREVATQQIDKLTMFIGGLAHAGMTDAMDNFDVDEAVRAYQNAVGGPPKIVRDADAVAAIRARRAQMMNSQMALQATEAGATAVQQLANSPMPNGGNVLSNMSQMAQNQAPVRR